MKWHSWLLVIAVLAILAVGTCGCAAMKGLKAIGQAAHNGPIMTAPPEGEPDPFGAILVGVGAAAAPVFPWATTVIAGLIAYRKRKQLIKTSGELLDKSQTLAVTVKVLQEMRQVINGNPALLQDVNWLEGKVWEVCNKYGIPKSLVDSIVKQVKEDWRIAPVSASTSAPASSPA